MRILHTGDWHLGKSLGPYSRLPEQEAFIDELVAITIEKAVDLLLVAGDVFDTYNPPAEAERLFFRTLKRLSDTGASVVVIAGNHDSHQRLTASAPLAEACGVLIAGLWPGQPFTKSTAETGYFELDLHGERAIIAVVPFPGERSLNILLNDEDTRGDYSGKVGTLMDKLSGYFRADTVNILVGHFYIAGGICSEASERPIQIGGAYAVDAYNLPQNAQYIAMGHLHRPQKIPGHPCAYYAGSPIQYALSETGYAKCVILADIEPGKPAAVEKIYLKNYKPVEHWRTAGTAQALDMLKTRGKSGSPCWVYLDIETDKPLTYSDIKALREANSDIVDINPIITAVDTPPPELERERSPEELFTAFYREKRNTPPSEAMMRLFNELLM